MIAWALFWIVSGHEMRNFFTCKPGTIVNPGSIKQTKFNYATVANRKPLQQDVEPLLRQVFLAWENPIHLPGHSLQAPALGSAGVSLSAVCQSPCRRVCTTPQQHPTGSGRVIGPGLATAQRNCPRGVPQAQGPSAPPCTLSAHGAGLPAPSRAGSRVSTEQARPLGSASRAHSASPPYLPAA